MKIELSSRSQLELTLDSTARPVRRSRFARRSGRRQQALWWFREMHRAVDEVMRPADAVPSRGGEARLLAGDV
jgi:hypothetical protein